MRRGLFCFCGTRLFVTPRALNNLARRSTPGYNSIDPYQHRSIRSYPERVEYSTEGVFMSQSLSKIWTHLVFSTKDRFPFLSDKTVRHDMHAYLAKILKANNCPTLLVGGVSDHVHLLFVLEAHHRKKTF
jgi:hypothetical protein